MSKNEKMSMMEDLANQINELGKEILLDNDKDKTIADLVDEIKENAVDEFSSLGALLCLGLLKKAELDKEYDYADIGDKKLHGIKREYGLLDEKDFDVDDEDDNDDDWFEDDEWEEEDDEGWNYEDEEDAGVDESDVPVINNGDGTFEAKVPYNGGHIIYKNRRAEDGNTDLTVLLMPEGFQKGITLFHSCVNNTGDIAFDIDLSLCDIPDRPGLTIDKNVAHIARDAAETESMPETGTGAAESANPATSSTNTTNTTPNT